MTPKPASPLVHCQDRVWEILSSHTWGTIGPVEAEASEAIAQHFGYAHCLLVHSQPAAVETLLRSLHRWPLDADEALDEVLTEEVNARLHAIGDPKPDFSKAKPRFLVVDFRSCAAVLTDEETVYGDLFAYHHCGHRPGTGATVDGTKDSILGGDMRVTEFQALAALVLLRP